MKRFVKIFALGLSVLHCCWFFGCTQTKTAPVVDNELKTEKYAPIDIVLNKEDQKEYSEFIDEVSFSSNSMWSTEVYYEKKESVDRLSQIGIKGLPMLIVKSIENENNDDIKESSEQGIALGMSLSRKRLFSATAILRIKFDSFVEPNKNAVLASKNYYTYWTYAKNKLPQIADLNMTAEEKASIYREFGILAVPYVVEEIEKGDSELARFFSLIGAHLTTPEYMNITDTIDPEKHTNTPSPTEEEIEDILLEGGKEFDYKVWYAENKKDLDNLFKFLDAYCAEYEAEQNK